MLRARHLTNHGYEARVKHSWDHTHAAKTTNFRLIDSSQRDGKTSQYCAIDLRHGAVRADDLLGAHLPSLVVSGHSAWPSRELSRRGPSRIPSPLRRRLEVYLPPAGPIYAYPPRSALVGSGAPAAEQRTPDTLAQPTSLVRPRLADHLSYPDVWLHTH